MPLDHNKYEVAIKNNFPNTNNDKVSRAEIGRELRALLNEDQKIIRFPNKKELQLILANTAKEAITKIDFKLFKSFNQLKRKTRDYVDSIGFYYVRGSIDPSYSTQFLWLEKLTKNWIKKNNLEFDQPISLSIYSPCSRHFGGQNINFNSYYDLSVKYLQRLRLIDEVLITKHEKLKDINELNSFLNYSENEFNCFNGLRRTFKNDNRRILPNPIVAALAKDEKADEIFEQEVLQYIENNKTRVDYLSAFEKLKKEYGT